MSLHQSENSNVKIFRLSDLIGGLSPKKPMHEVAELVSTSVNGKKLDKRPKRTRNSGKNAVVIEPSSFKMSNRIAVHGNKPKKQKSAGDNNTDVLWLHNDKQKYFQCRALTPGKF